MTSLCLSGGTVLTMDQGRPFVEFGSVLIEDGRIVEVLEGAVRHGETIDCRGRVVLPGLVNAHAHGLESLFRGAGGELALLPWIERTHALMDRLDREGAHIAGRLTAAEMLRGGVTAYLDPEVPTDDRFDGVVTALEASGIRAGVTLLLEDLGGYHHWSARSEPNLTDQERGILDRWSPTSLVRPFIGPSVLSAITPDFARAIRGEADARGVRIAFHCAEVEEDLADSTERGGGSPVEFGEAIGLVGSTSVLTHGVHLTATDAAILASRDASLVHCPSSNAKLGSGVAPIALLVEHGVNVALGTDGSVCNDGHDMFQEMRLAALLQKAVRRDPAAMSPEQVLAMATVNGARALGVDAGRLAAGGLADVIVVDLDRLGSQPTPNLVDTLVYTGTREAVVDVIVGGEARVRNGKLVDVDLAGLLRTARAVAAQAIEDAGLSSQLRPRWAVPEETAAGPASLRP